ncbi:hypothetical protein L210DRAFT_840512 [Boletus edulis BED1]|uniref:GYF domain-containing protein n=1 Tax=Boletus edulis BED1 TaxID=1328754 RepID=A0AAD4C244_BOLED|nr:hypothetical protein L210DRAFT_840512 [Boletus edulis BED1]
MATTTMHFGPEWMRAKPQTLPARHQPPPSPSPPQSAAATQSQQLATSTYSALVTPVAQEPDKRDESRPFRFTKDEMLRIYKEGGGRGGLNLEVERWEGIVRDVGTDPVGLREMSEVEKKLFAGPLNSELRRRQSADLTNSLSSPSDRQRLSHSNSATNSTMRYGPFMGRRRDSTDQSPLHLPRKLSLSNIQGGTLASPRDALPSPRNRIGAFSSGFDGVLNSGDSWSRKRPSAGVAGLGGGILARGEGKEEDARYSEIKEEEESTTHHSTDVHDGDPAAIMNPPSSGPNVPPSNPTPVGPLSSSDVGQGMAGMSLETLHQPNPNTRVSSTTNPLPSGPPPGLTDPASIEWSYLDPQGQVQGPFRADVMQKWFDDGYFIPDLLVKRTRIDADWIAVRILERRAAGANIFLSQISSGPPGLAIHTESPKSYSPAHEQSMFNGYQPVPTRTLRPTLDSYLNRTSPTESPSSSLGAGRFGNGSPDMSTFGGRTGSNVYSSDSTFGGRAAFQDSVSDARTLNNNSMGRVPTIDTFNAYSGGGDSSPWSAGPGQIGQSFNDNEQHPYSNGFNGIGSGMIGNPLPVNHTHSINQEHFRDTTYSGMGGLGGHHDSPIARQPSEVNGMSFNSSTMNGLGSQFGAPAQFSQSPSVPYAVQHHQSVSPFVDLLSQTPEAPNVTQTPISAVQPKSASPWTANTRPFEPPAAPSPVVPPARPQVPERVTPQPAPPVDPSPWLMASLPVVDDVWREMPGPNSLTFSNLGQHNKLQQQDEEGADDAVIPPSDVAPLLPDPQPVQTESTNAVSTSVTAAASHSVTLATTSTSTPGIQSSTAQKARRKSTARDVQVPAPKVAPPTVTTVVRDQAPAPTLPATPLKPAWAVEDDSKKQKGAAAAMSLREIQEAEVREAEARKAAEKERERLARANAVTSGNSVAEEGQLFTSSWGLPTSQVGVRNQIPPRETSTNSPISATPGAPVWTNVAPTPAAKKTMKEIQEEEERRKKLAVKESMASATARRGYAETTVKVIPSAPAPSGPWTTVGPNGKSTTPATNIPRPAVNTTLNNPTPVTTLRTNGTVTRQAVAATVKAASPRVEDIPPTPSHDFLKWLGESIKGLNTSVNLEEMISMLLSFPLDPDQSTIEIISDLIYANSTTLDGRRFASEYVNRRKVDAASRRGTVGSSGPSNKPVSIADVVKTQPKPAQQEWGFKVVNKKKKGGRS